MTNEPQNKCEQNILLIIKSYPAEIEALLAHKKLEQVASIGSVDQSRERENEIVVQVLYTRENLVKIIQWYNEDSIPVDARPFPQGTLLWYRLPTTCSSHSPLLPS